ncbi:MAG: phosphate regulon sensor histidine kinase PhoR [Comamonadaceae bacterium]|nr:phosphate regulon sensor histidine kinase PhoR [Burkholderiales bacterium]MEB2349016.1 phosphate regulon sensor histidine kinase PhoR [Comamonadaceae bacterium]
MLARLLLFAGLQLAGGALGWWQAGVWGAVAGACVAAWLWFAWDAWCATRLLAWLRRGEQAAPPRLPGAWSALADRVRRLLRQREKAVQASEARLQAVLAAIQASPNGVLLLDDQDRIEWCNQQAAEHFGVDVQRDLMQSVGNLLREPAFSAYLAAGDFTHDVLLPGRESTPAHPVQLAVRLYPYGDGRRLMLSRDVTQLQQAEAMRRDFVANVSHEIRTPLTVLTGFVETMQTLPLAEAERARYLGLMAQQAQRMRDLVQDLLTLSRLEGGPAPGLQEWTPVRELLQRCEQEAREFSQRVLPPGSAPHQWHFPAAVEFGAMEIAGNAAELHSALSNLLSNAVRYTPAGGTIAVAWQPQPDGGASVCVRDSGPGIAPEHLPRLTERFYRVDRGRSRESGGTGLGLAIVKHVLQRHGAQLRIASVVGQGSEFCAVFPAQRLRQAPPR